MVSGLVDADIYKVQEGKIAEKKISTKKLAIYALKEGGTKEQQLGPDQQNMQTLKDEQILQLEKTGRRIEAYFGRPQDIEWCLYEGKFYIVQSRPITTLYPIPNVNDGKNHVYMSLSHQQMMTDTIKPLDMSLFQISFSRGASNSTVEATVLDNYGVGIVGIYAQAWLSKNMEKWLDEKNATDILSQSLSNNITAEMGLELLDVADVVRQYPAVIEYFQYAKDETFFEELAKLEVGNAASDSIRKHVLWKIRYWQLIMVA